MPKPILIEVTAEVNSLIEANVLPGHTLDSTQNRRLPNGNWIFPIDVQVRARIDLLKFPGESDSDVLLRLLHFKQSSVRLQ